MKAAHYVLDYSLGKLVNLFGSVNGASLTVSFVHSSDAHSFHCTFKELALIASWRTVKVVSENREMVIPILSIFLLWCYYGYMC